jgi:nucleotide-binding universal stress UspA family protein
VRHLLVGTDLSARSKPALDRAIQLAAQYQAKQSSPCFTSLTKNFPGTWSTISLGLIWTD